MLLALNSSMKTRRSKAMTVTPFANPERQFQARREVLPAPIHNIYSFYESESSESDTKNVDIETLTLEQYLALDPNNTRRRFTYPDNSTFEIKGQLLRELRKISFSGGPTDSAVKHISNVLEIACIFNAQESTLVQVFPLTLKGIAKRWFERTSTECTKSWSDLKQNFIRRFCPPAMIFKQLSEIQNFKQEDGESLFDTWERYNDLLFKCPFHELNDHQKVNTFYNGLNSQTRRAVDSNGLVPGLTASDALKSIQKLVEHSHKWHCEENHMTTLDPLRIITEKLKLLNHEMEELKVDFRKLNTDDDRKSYYAEVKSIRSSKIDYDKTYTEPSNSPTNLKDKFEKCLKESGERQAIQNEWMKKIMISTDLSLKNHDSSIKRLEQKVNHLAQLISTHNPKHTLMPKTETFDEKVKRRILEENKEPTTTHDKPKQQLQKAVSHEIKELPTHYSATLQNKLPLKETDPGSFILPCIIINHSMSNALADLGASISVMPCSLFKRLGLESLKPIKMTIEMADKSMQSPKGIKENVLVKISNFVFPVDFVVLDIMEDENVLIILGRPMLATTHAKIDVYGKKISLGVGNDQVAFNINKKESPAFISPICVINELDKTQELDDLVMNGKKVWDFENYLSPEYESQDIVSLSPSELAKVKEDFSMTLCDPDKRMSIGLEEFVDIDDMWEDLDLGILSNEKAKTEFLKSGGRIHLHSPDNLKLSCKIGFVNFNPYFEAQTPFNIMSIKAYNTIMNHELMYLGINMVDLLKIYMCS
ncbi:homeodomain-like protein [Tanacetum coccineum]